MTALSAATVGGFAGHSKRRGPPPSPWDEPGADVRAPVTSEVTHVDLPVRGELPAALCGHYMRTGPNPVDPGRRSHWFLGDAMVHTVRLADGRALWYRNRWLRTAEVHRALGEPPAAPPAPVCMPGAGAAGVVAHAGRVWALNEPSLPLELDPATGSVQVLEAAAAMPFGMNAHPKLDPVTGELHAFSYFPMEPYLNHHVIDAAGAVVRSTAVPLAGPSMVHDAVVTDTWLVVMDLPVVFSANGLMRDPPFPYAWNEGYASRLVLQDRATDRQVAIDLPEPCFVFHYFNAWDEPDGQVAILAVRYDRMFTDDVPGPDHGRPRVCRIDADPGRGSLRVHDLDDRAFEFPRIDDRRLGRSSRYGVTIGSGRTDFATGCVSQVARWDFRTGTCTELRLPDAVVLSELSFVPHPDRDGEDDGWLVGYAQDRRTGSSELLVLAAGDVASGPVARVSIPARVPVGFHGNWIPDP